LTFKSPRLMVSHVPQWKERERDGCKKGLIERASERGGPAKPFKKGGKRKNKKTGKAPARLNREPGTPGSDSRGGAHLRDKRLGRLVARDSDR